MTDANKPVFPILVDGAGSGLGADQAVDATTAAAALNGLVGFAFKDSTGKVILPQLDAMGAIPVSTASAGTKKRARGSVAGGATAQTVATIALTATKVYNTLSALVSCRRGCLFQVILNDNGTPTVLAEMIVDAGQYTFDYSDPYEFFTAGATGTQQLLLKGTNFTVGEISDLHGTITTLEAP